MDPPLLTTHAQSSHEIHVSSSYEIPSDFHSDKGSCETSESHSSIQSVDDVQRNLQSAQSTSSSNTISAHNNAMESTFWDSVPSVSTEEEEANREHEHSSLARPSFSTQLAKLTSQLPEAATLSTALSSLSSLLTASAAAKALTGAAEQVRRWIQRATEVVKGLDADDDVQWSVTAGRDGVSTVDRTVNGFEAVMCLYVVGTEELQLRADIGGVQAQELNGIVEQMDATVAEWKELRAGLKRVKEQVELAMEWEELSNVVVGDIGVEMDDLNRFIFEAEERRHKVLMTEMRAPGDTNLALVELENLMEKTSMGSGRRPERDPLRSPSTYSSSSSLSSPNSAGPREDPSLLALNARMQPLRASLDFLPMRLASFHLRAQGHFPTACLELQMRRKGLESKWEELRADAQALRRELTEDRYVYVFRNAGRHGQKMCQSLVRSLARLREAVDSDPVQQNPVSLSSQAEKYEARKTHYGASIERVLAIISQGIKDRRTANGEVLRLQSDLERQWMSVQVEMRKMDAELQQLHLTNPRRSTRSVSSAVSLWRPVSSNSVGTRETSPPSSVAVAHDGAERKRRARFSMLPLPATSSVKSRQSSRRSSSFVMPSSSDFSSPSAAATAAAFPQPYDTSSSSSPAAMAGQKAEQRRRFSRIPRPTSSSSQSNPSSRRSSNAATLRSSGAPASSSGVVSSKAEQKKSYRLSRIPRPTSSSNVSNQSSRRSSNAAAVLPSFAAAPSSMTVVNTGSAGVRMSLPSDAAANTTTAAAFTTTTTSSQRTRPLPPRLPLHIGRQRPISMPDITAAATAGRRTSSTTTTKKVSPKSNKPRWRH